MDTERRRQKVHPIIRVSVVALYMLLGVVCSRSFYKKAGCSAIIPSLTQQKSCRFMSRLPTSSNGAAEEMNHIKVQAKYVSVSDIDACGERLREGRLVSFPTETVYGLGCNALDPTAIVKVFEAKERPLTDPLITHVSDNNVAYKLWKAAESSLENQALRCLCDRFWPGPLTIVAKAASHVPDLLMANTGFVACRSPQHPVSIALIEAAQVPIAAPSANKFGHVSPTRARHVWDDLKHEDVWIVETADQDESADVCNIGVESSVAKIEMDDGASSGKVTLLRQGAISVSEIHDCLREAGLIDKFTVQAKTKKATDETVAQVAPGQTIRHYSPEIPSFILSEASIREKSNPSPEELAILCKTVVVDFGGKLRNWRDTCIAYRDLSESGDPAQATKSVFEILRWAERVVGAKQIIFPEIVEKESGNGDDALILALKDRLTRAASGVIIDRL